MFFCGKKSFKLKLWVTVVSAFGIASYVAKALASFFVFRK